MKRKNERWNDERKKNIEYKGKRVREREIRKRKERRKGNGREMLDRTNERKKNTEEKE